MQLNVKNCNPSKQIFSKPLALQRVLAISDVEKLSRASSKFLSSLTHMQLFCYPSKVAAQDNFLAKLATRLLINYEIRKYQKLQRLANTNRIH